MRNPYFDIVRGLAIFGVVAVHTIATSNHLVSGPKSEFITELLSLGRYGVELFFLLSGALLCSIYGMGNGKLSRTYFVKRAARIYPLWLLFLLIQVVRSLIWNSGGFDLGLKTVPGESSLLHSPLGIVILTLTFTLFVSGSLWNLVIPGGWSIQSEVAHYLLFPIMRKIKLIKLTKILIMINFGTGALFMARSNLEGTLVAKILVEPWLRLSLYSTLGYFYLGILCVLLFQDTRAKNSIRPDLKILDLSPKIFLMYVISIFVIPCPFGSQIEAIGYIVVNMLIATGILRIEKLKRIFLVLGKYSYFIYFAHILLLELATQLLQALHLASGFPGTQIVAFATLFSLVLMLSVLLAIPSMKYVENPSRRFAHRLENAI
jgi:peptidoglycan/LPS O-acetylase OafA/YrhL